MRRFLIGLGFIQVWLWVFFLNGPLLHELSGPSAERAFAVFLFFVSLSFLITALASSRLAPLSEKPLLLTAGALSASLGPVLLALLPGGPALGGIGAVTVLAAAISGAGIAWLVIAWGEVFSGHSTRDGAAAFARAVALGTVFFFLSTRLNLTAGVVAAFLYPWFSLIFLFLNRKLSPPKEANLPPARRTFFPLPPRLAPLIFVFYVAGGLMYKIIFVSTNPRIPQAFWLTNLIYAGAMIAVAAVFWFYADFELRHLFRPILPLLGAGFMLFPFTHQTLAVLPFALFQAGFALFDVYTWLLFAYLAARDPRPTLIFGWGFFLVTFSILSGQIASTLALPSGFFTADRAGAVSLAGALIMLFSTVVFHGKGETFSGWENGAEAAALSAGNYPPQAEPVLLIEGWLAPYNLTVREQEIFFLLIEGRNNPYMREELNISNNTLKSHLRNMYTKFSVNNRQKLIDLYTQRAEKSLTS